MNTLNNENYYDDYTKTLKVHTLVEDQYDDISGDVINANLQKMLYDDFFAFFTESPFYEKYKMPRKMDKADYEIMFTYFRDKLTHEDKYTLMDIFMVFAEFFDANYKVLYNSLSNLDKENMLRELGSQQNIKSKTKTVKLF